MKKFLLKVGIMCMALAVMAGVVVVNSEKDQPGPIGSIEVTQSYV